MGAGPYRFRDDHGVEWLAVFYNGPADRFAHADRPGERRVAFFLGTADGEPACDVAAPEEIPDPPPEAWLRSLLEGARILKAMMKAASSA